MKEYFILFFAWVGLTTCIKWFIKAVTYIVTHTTIEKE